MSNSGPHGDVGTGWVAEPEHWSLLAPGDVLELGGCLVMVAAVGAHEGRRWLQTWVGGDDSAATDWAFESGDPLAMVLRRRDVLVGEVIGQVIESG